jgi:hypothetical protein
MSTIINTRSPFYVKIASSPLSSVELKLYVWEGVVGGRPASPEYTLTKSELSNDDYVVFEISELLRDFIYTNYYTEAVDVIWVQWSYNIDGGGATFETAHLAIDGFGYFEEGINPRTSIDPQDASYTPMLLQDNATVYFIKGEEIKLPIWAETEPYIDFTFTGGDSVEWQLVDDFWDTYDVTWNSSLVDVQITDNGNSNQKVQYLGIAPTDGIETGDTAVISSTIGNAQSITVTFKEICELKYTPVRIVFYNKYGAIQDLWASKKSTKSLSQSAETYKANIIDLDTLSYSTYAHTQKRFDVQGQESISVSTSYMDESINEPVKQLLMSEQVWLEIGSDTYPVTLKTSSVQEKTSVNDKLVAYTFEFDFASGKIQNVR